ncbi:4010_t:CDS:2, partial [Dentiscutata heterogama]
GRALTSKRAVEVAAFFFDIFTIFRLLLILQSDNGKEFVSLVIVKLVYLWPTIQIINGRSRYSASQDLAERANGILEIKLEKWIDNNNSQDWLFRLRFVIYTMNNLICRAYNKIPYELVFGGLLYRHSAVLDHLFETSIFLEDEIPNKFGLKNIQELINSLDDLINNINNEIKLLSIQEYPDLDYISSDYIFVRKAAQSQST